MQELSLNVLDIVQNSIKAKATLIEINIVETSNDNTMSITIIDNGCGMSTKQVESVVDPFYTTRTTRKVGLGVPFFKMGTEMTGGDFSINSKVGEGTRLTARYCTDHIDMIPLGDMASTMLSLISVNPEIDFVYSYTKDNVVNYIDTREIKTVLEGVLINEAEVLQFIKDSINEWDNI